MHWDDKIGNKTTMGSLVFYTFRSRVVKHGKSVMERMNERGFNAEGGLLGDRRGGAKLLNAWFSVFGVILLFYAGGARPCTLTACSAVGSAKDGSSLVLSSSEKTRRVQREVYRREGELQAYLLKLLPAYCFCFTTPFLPGKAGAFLKVFRDCAADCSLSF